MGKYDNFGMMAALVVNHVRMHKEHTHHTGFYGYSHLEASTTAV
jgi:hypothetical protein